MALPQFRRSRAESLHTSLAELEIDQGEVTVAQSDGILGDLGEMCWSEICILAATIRDELRRADDAVVRGVLEARLVEARAAIAQIESRWHEDGDDLPGDGRAADRATLSPGGDGGDRSRADRAGVCLPGDDPAVGGGERQGTNRLGAAVEVGEQTGTGLSRGEDLDNVLRRLQNGSPDVEVGALISDDGLVIASVLPQDTDETRVAAMGATILRLALWAAAELGRGNVEEVIVRGDKGYAAMLSTGRGVFLLTLANESAQLGLIASNMQEAASEVRQIL